MNINFEEYNTLTLSEKICFGKIESLSFEILHFTLEELAEYCQVSTATINRTLKKIGYKNLKEYKKTLPIDRESNQVSNFENQLIDLIKHHSSDITNDILEASKVYIVAFGITSSLANDFIIHLRDLKINCEAITDSDMLSYIQSNDDQTTLIIYISYSGADLDMQKAAVNNKSKIKQILITCTTNSILSYSCDKVICTNTNKSDNNLKSRIPLYIVVMKQIEILNSKR